MTLTLDNWKSLLEHGFELQSSGTTGESKHILQTPEKLAAANKVAIEAQKITAKSRVLTVCRMSHAGGALAQTLPALSVGAHVAIKPFNAYRFWSDVSGYTHTHLTPAHCEALIKTKTFQSINLDGLFVTCGSDNVSFDIIDAFVRRGATFMCNWGMTEIGPIVINTVFDSVGRVDDYRDRCIASASLMGDRYYCDYRIVGDTLHVNGDTCVYDGWFDTRDRVRVAACGEMYHLGRCN